MVETYSSGVRHATCQVAGWLEALAREDWVNSYTSEEQAQILFALNRLQEQITAFKKVYCGQNEPTLASLQKEVGKTSIAKFEFCKHEELTVANGHDTFVARCRPLGLTAYGKTEQEADEHLVHMFRNAEPSVLRQEGRKVLHNKPLD
jgi:hypothetical protein